MATTSVTPTKSNGDYRERNGGPLMSPAGFPFFMSRLQDEFDQVFRRFTRGWPSLWESNAWRWDVDVHDGEQEIAVRAEAPGFEPADFDVQVRGNELVLRACRKTKKELKGGFSEEDKEYFQAITLPSGIDAEKVTAKYDKGVLNVTLPKKPEAKGRKIPITAG
jgi:HSP20 family protein